jgi:hypothetical protein
MTRTQGRIIAGVISILLFVFAQVAKDAQIFGLSPAVAQALVIVVGALGIANNWLPNIWHSEPAPLPGNPTGAPNP